MAWHGQVWQGARGERRSERRMPVGKLRAGGGAGVGPPDGGEPEVTVKGGAAGVRLCALDTGSEARRWAGSNVATRLRPRI
jgi:hypothetical protein